MKNFHKNILGICLVQMLMLSGCSLEPMNPDVAEIKANELGDTEINGRQCHYQYLPDIDAVDTIGVYFQNLPQKWNEALWVACRNWNEIPKCKVEFMYATSPTGAEVIVKTGTISGTSRATLGWTTYPPSQGIPGKSITILTSFDITTDWGVNYDIVTSNDVWTLKNGTIGDLRLLREATMMHELGHTGWIGLITITCAAIPLLQGMRTSEQDAFSM